MTELTIRVFESVTDEMCRAANDAYHNGHHGHLGAMHSALVAAMSVYLSRPISEDVIIKALDTWTHPDNYEMGLDGMRAVVESVR